MIWSRVHRFAAVPLLIPACLSVAACAQTPGAELPDAPSTVSHQAPPAEPTGPTAVFDTSLGRMTCKLYQDQAPKTVASFVGLADGSRPWTDPATHEKVTGKSFYNGTTFHRVIPGFMVQGGDRLGTGMGDAGFYLPDEFNPTLRFDVPGRLAMANAGPGTAGSQFFITETANADLNGSYTIFGQCDQHSVLIAATIARVPRDREDKPLQPVTLNKLTIVPAGAPVPPDPTATAAPSTSPGAAGPASSANDAAAAAAAKAAGVKPQP
jgi:peptidyl-prolyl cis-trans isomerase A (cyclophilin A)